jgi:hypothetical protein
MQQTANLTRKYLEKVTNANHKKQLYRGKNKYNGLKAILFSIVYNTESTFLSLPTL